MADFFKQLKQGKGMKKSTWLVLLLVGILLMVVAVPTSEKNEEEEAQTTKDEELSVQTADYVTELENRLEQTLSQIEGAGKVTVMITLEDTGEKEVEKDETTRQSKDETSSEYEQSTQTVYDESKDSTPYISNEKYPLVKGVCVVAQGGGDSSVKEKILSVVEALFGLGANKIVVVKMGA
jgi:stage III sporulation protein AG